MKTDLIGIMKNFKKEAEEWTNKELNNWINTEHFQIYKDSIELMMFGSIGFRYKDGEYTKVSQQELWEMKLHPDNEVSTFHSMEEYSEYLKSAKKK